MRATELGVPPNITKERFSKLVGELPVGKVVDGSTYIHTSQLLKHSTELSMLGIPMLDDYMLNVFRFDPGRFRLLLLAYRRFEYDPFPVLDRLIDVDLESWTAEKYRANHNHPPILLRKELLWPDHPKADEWAELTKRCEDAGLDTSMRNTREGWKWRMNEAGFEL